MLVLLMIVALFKAASWNQILCCSDYGYWHLPCLMHENDKGEEICENFEPDKAQVDKLTNQLKNHLKQNIESIKDKPLDSKHTAAKSSTYAKTFELMLDILVYIVFCGREITWKDIQENVADKHKQSLIRQLKALKDLGYLEDGGIPRNRIQTFYATEKSRQLFGLKTGMKKNESFRVTG